MSKVKNQDSGFGIWICAAAAGFCLFLIFSLLILILANGFLPFWPETLEKFTLRDGSQRLGVVTAEESCLIGKEICKLQIKQANRDTYGEDYIWLAVSAISKRDEFPSDATVVERQEWGKVFGLGGVTYERDRLVLQNVDGQRLEIPREAVLDTYQPNSYSYFGRFRHFLRKLWEFLSTDPREANTEGGVLPSIYGTVIMVFIMSIVVTPFGVLAAIYLREYARKGLVVDLIRIAVNNLAGVPSIVFGVFGLGFFVYGLGGGIDRLFFSERLPTPTFGTGGLLWASLTLALLTVPTVIVAAEEGLAAIPRDLRDGSYALGATKFETIWKVVLPSLTPSILTGVILAIARAAGEVAPLMITGVVKLAPSPPLDNVYPFVHLERKFMHLGFHIFDVGFQSPNVDAARPMVFATTLLLIVIVVLLNLLAMIVRNRLRSRYLQGAV